MEPLWSMARITGRECTLPVAVEFAFCPICATALEPLPAGHRDAGRPACPEGHFVHYDNPAVTTYAFIADAAGRYLALRRAHPPCVGEWDLPLNRALYKGFELYLNRRALVPKRAA